MEMKARQLNNRRNKTKSYSPACLRTVQIESKTRRGNCEEPRLEIPPPPPSPGPAPSLAPPPPSSLPALPPQCLFQACATRRWRQREGSSRQPGGAEVRRRCSLAGSAAFIISRKSQFHFHFPTSRLRGSNKRQRVSVWLAPRGARFSPWPGWNGDSRSGGPGAGSGSGHQLGDHREGRSYLTLHTT